MKESTTRGVISLEGPCGLVYDVGEMMYTVREDETFRYVFTPNWAVIDLLEPPDFQGVPGFDLDLRKDKYVRENVMPVFVSERAPSKNREDLWQMLEAQEMEYLDQLEWLIRTDTRYIGDKLYVRAPEDSPAPHEVDAASAIEHAANSEHAMRILLKALCRGADVLAGGVSVSNEGRRALHKVLLPLYEKACRQRERKRLRGVRAAADRGAYAGRKRKPVDEVVLREVFTLYDEGKVDVGEAAARLDISVSTFYRRLKERRAQG